MKAAYKPPVTNSTHKRLSKDQRRLREVRSMLCLSQVEMAERLGVSLSRLQSYEYGRTKGVNKDVMAAVEQLVTDPTAFTGLSHVKPIRACARDWMKRLDMRDGAQSDLANVLGVDRATVSRWFSTGAAHQEPNPRAISAYEAMVSAVERVIDARTGARKRQRTN